MALLAVIMTACPVCGETGRPVLADWCSGAGGAGRGYQIARDELDQAIPPAFTEHIGGYLAAALEVPA